MELGGTDQTFNLLMGRDDPDARTGSRRRSVLTMPLLVGTDGAQKMSKSLGNHIGITEPPAEMFGKTMSIPDDAARAWYDLLLGAAPPAGLGPRDAKRALARALVERFHGPAAARRRRPRFERVFVARELPADVEEAGVPAADGVVHLPALIAAVFGGSRSEARRAIAAGRREARRRAGRAGRARRAAERARRRACCRSASGASGACAWRDGPHRACCDSTRGRRADRRPHRGRPRGRAPERRDRRRGRACS